MASHCTVSMWMAVPQSKHVAKVYTQRVSEAFHVVDGYVSLTTFNGAHIGAMKLRQLCEVLLGELTLEPEPAHAGRKLHPCCHYSSPRSHGERASSR